MEIRNHKNIRIGEVLQELGYVTDEQIGEIISAMEKQICEQFPAKEAE